MWGLTLNEGKTQMMALTRSTKLRNREMILRLNGEVLKRVKECEHLGVILDERMELDTHCQTLLKKMRSRRRMVMRIGGWAWGCPPDKQVQTFNAFVKSLMAHAMWAFGSCEKKCQAAVQAVCTRACKRTCKLHS